MFDNSMMLLHLSYFVYQTKIHLSFYHLSFTKLMLSQKLNTWEMFTHLNLCIATTTHNFKWVNF